MLVIRKSWLNQPPTISTPLNSRLRAPTVVWSGASWDKSYVLNEAAVLGGSTLPTQIPTARGLSASFVYSAATYPQVKLCADADSVFTSSTQTTIAVLRRCRDTTARNTYLFAYHEGSAGVDRVLSHAPYSDGNLYWDFGNSTAGSGRVSVAFTKTTEWETLVFVAGGGKGREVWRNGIRIVNNTSATASRNAVSASFVIGGFTTIYASAESDNVDIALFIVSAEAWTDAEIVRWSRNPFGMTFAPQVRRIWTGTVASALPTLSASTYKPGTLTADGWQPRVTAT